MQAVDTNILVYAEMQTSEHHLAARQVLRSMAEGPSPWAIPWPCIYEFLRVVTHSKVFHPPMPVDAARRDLQHILSSPSVLVLHETGRHQELLFDLMQKVPLAGNLWHDAHIAVLCYEHGVDRLLTADADFHRFPNLTVHNPLHSSGATS